MKLGQLKNNGKWIIFVLAISAVGYFLLANIASSFGYSLDSLKYLVPLTITIFAGNFAADFFSRKKLFTKYNCFVLSFICFHFGLFFVYAFGGNYNYFYLKSYDSKIVIQCFLYQYLCVCCLFVPPLFMEETRPLRFSLTRSLDEKSVHSFSFVGTLLTGAVAFLLILAKGYVFFTNNRYYSVRAFEESLNSFVTILEYMFVPFLILLVVFAKNKNIKRLE